jgi:hypothetical protein
MSDRQVGLIGHFHDRQRNPRRVAFVGGGGEWHALGNGNGYAMRAHLLAEHPELAAELLACGDGGVGVWPTVSYVDEAHKIEHDHARLLPFMAEAEPFLGATATECPACRHLLMAPAAYGHGDGEHSWDTWHCEGCGQAWSLDLSRRVSREDVVA